VSKTNGNFGKEGKRQKVIDSFIVRTARSFAKGVKELEEDLIQDAYLWVLGGLRFRMLRYLMEETGKIKLVLDNNENIASDSSEACSSIKFKQVLEGFDHREQAIAFGLYNGFTEDELAKHFNIKQQRIHQIVEKMRSVLRGDDAIH
jgi:hypothetical protein